jgi:hypothetical protein
MHASDKHAQICAVKRTSLDAHEYLVGAGLRTSDFIKLESIRT